MLNRDALFDLLGGLRTGLAQTQMDSGLGSRLRLSARHLGSAERGRVSIKDVRGGKRLLLGMNAGGRFIGCAS